jgi:tetratricopeptide (TPR) repeat protein
MAKKKRNSVAKKRPSAKRARNSRTKSKPEYNPEYAELLDKAQACLDRGEHSEAIELVESLLLDDVRKSDSTAFLYASRLSGFAAAHLNDFDRAKTLALNALAVDDTLLDFYYLLVYLFNRLEDYTLVDIYGQKYLEVFGKIPSGEAEKSTFAGTYDQAHEVLNNMGVALREQGDLQEAVDLFERAVNLKSDYAVAWINLANLADHMGQRDDAITLLDNGITKCPGIPELKMLRDAIVSSKPEISLCMIVKNEEDQLARALESVKNVVDEIIVVDTGSTDRTVEIAESFGAKVYFHEWENDFAKARNQSLGYATKEWIFILDADEEFVREDIPQLNDILAQKRNNFISVSVFNHSDDGQFASFLPSIRFFRRSTGAHYDGIVHNQLKFDEKNEIVLRVGVRINHYGYGLSPEKMKKKIARSKELLLKQLDENPNDPFANMNLAQLYRGESQRPGVDVCDKIIFHAQKVLDNTDPTSSSRGHLHMMALHQMASAYFYKERFDTAKEYCHTALKYKPDYLDPIITLGYIHSQMQEWDDARKWYLKYLEERERFADSSETDSIILLNYRSEQNAFYGVAHSCEKLGLVDEAMEWYLKTAEVREGYLDTHLRLAQLFFNRKEFESVITHARIQLDHDENAWPAHYLLGEAYRMLGKAIPSESHLKKADAMEPDNKDIILALANLYFDMDRLREASIVSDRLENQFPDFVHAAGVIGDIRYATGAFDKAIAAYEKCVAAGGANANVWNNLGNSYFKLSQFERAYKCYSNALREAPDMAFAQRNLGISLAKSGQFEKAAGALSSYLELAPDDFDVAHLLGDIMSESGHFESALKMYELCISLDSGSHMVITKIADIYYRQGNYDSAKLGYYQALKLKPDYEPARTKLEALEVSAPEGI